MAQGAGNMNDYGTWLVGEKQWVCRCAPVGRNLWGNGIKYCMACKTDRPPFKNLPGAGMWLRGGKMWKCQCSTSNTQEQAIDYCPACHTDRPKPYKKIARTGKWQNDMQEYWRCNCDSPEPNLNPRTCPYCHACDTIAPERNVGTSKLGKWTNDQRSHWKCNCVTGYNIHESTKVYCGTCDTSTPAEQEIKEGTQIDPVGLYNAKIQNYLTLMQDRAKAHKTWLDLMQKEDEAINELGDYLMNGLKEKSSVVFAFYPNIYEIKRMPKQADRKIKYAITILR